MSVERVTYVDSSAIVKLVVREAESAALRLYLKSRTPLVSSALARVEVTRALLPLGSAVLRRGDDVLRRIDLVRISDHVLDAAGRLLPEYVRSLDAIHLATAALFEDTLGQIVTYDRRMAQAAEDTGSAVASPA